MNSSDGSHYKRMAQIAKKSARMKLLRWNKALSLADASDPLGLSLSHLGENRK
jgi:hypothetical protein